MPEDLDIREVTQADLDTTIDDYSVDRESIDEAGTQDTTWENSDFSEYYGYYKDIPELRQAINALATWTAGKGYQTKENRTKAILDRITGWGEDTFQTIMENMIVIKKVNGDAYAEIMRNDEGDVVNLKPLNPARMKTVVNPKGMIIRYEETDASRKKVIRKYEPQDILHLCNERAANEIHGTSVIESCKWVIDARNEAMSDWRKMLHRSSIRILYIDEDDTTKLDTLKDEYEDALNNGNMMILPSRKGEAVFEDLTPQSPQAYMNWIQYLENFFYQAVGVPKIILGGSQEFTEASAKVGYLTFEQVYMREQRELEADLWNQLAIKVTFERPVSLKDNVVQSEGKNTGQLGVQPTETTTTIERTE